MGWDRLLPDSEADFILEKFTPIFVIIYPLFIEYTEIIVYTTPKLNSST